VNLTGERLLDLTWRAHSPVRRGCLARWDDPGESGRSRRLTVAGSYDRDGVPPVAPGSSWAADAFPPEEFLTALGMREDYPVLVLPVRTAGTDWGVLALAGPGDSARSWPIAETLAGLSLLAGYLSSALERNDLLRSLEAERQLLQTLLDAVPDYIYFKDRSSRLVRANKAHAAYVGLQSQAEGIGKTDFDFYPQDVAQALHDAEQEMMRTGQPLIGVIEDHSAVAQRPCWIQATKVPIVRDGSVVGLVGISRDITELKRAEGVLARQAAAAEELAELRSSFVATVSHELRSPLTAIVGYAELLEAQWRRLDDPDRLKMIHRIVTSANRQQRLIEELILLSRLESGPVVAVPEPVMLDRLVRRAVEEIRTSFQGQAFDLTGPADLLVLADPDRALQILLNLIDNAAKYSPEGFPIHVSLSQNSAQADVRVRDFGAGVSERGRERLFTRFGRLPGSRIRAGRVGTGLGLYLARGFARAMRGEVDLESTGLGGSTFRLSLPLAAGAESAAEDVRR
jgi:PAS domain S-box-containing protein